MVTVEKTLTLVETSTDDHYLACLRCGLCLYTCPTYLETLLESDSPRGRIALAKAVAEGSLELSERYADRIYRCTLCAACQEICPSGVAVEELLLDVRARLAGEGWLSPGIQRLTESLGQSHNISGEDNRRRLIWTENLSRPPSGIGKRQAEIVYFVGCVSSFFPASYSIPQALCAIMDASGVDYTLLGEHEYCCGFPLLASGQSSKAVELVQHNVDQVLACGAHTVVTTCPSCYHMWHVIYPEVVPSARNVRVLHATEWLAEMLEVGARHSPSDSCPCTPRHPMEGLVQAGPTLRLRPLPARATYHDPCDLGRKSGVYDPPRRILRQIPGLELVEMGDYGANALCCGGGGNLESHDPALTAALADRRIQQAVEAGAQYLVSACQQCKRTLASAARRLAQRNPKARLRVVDVIELVAQLQENG